MQKQLVAIAAGAFSFGALVSWAITADHYSYRNRMQANALRGVMRGQAKTFARLQEERKVEETSADFVQPASAQEIYENAEHLIGVEIAPDEVEIVSEIETPDVPEGETVDETRSRLQSIISEYTASKEMVEDFVEKAGRTIEFNDQEPFEISAERFAFDPEEDDDYAKEHLVWYANSRILTDEDGDPIREVGLKIGWDSIQHFGGDSFHPDIIYVRNPRELTDYEVERTYEELPIHIRYGMPKTEFEAHKAAGNLKLRPEDQ